MHNKRWVDKEHVDTCMYGVCVQWNTYSAMRKHEILQFCVTEGCHAEQSKLEDKWSFLYVEYKETEQGNK